MRDPHDWSEWESSRCVRCGCTRAEWEDNIRPQCKSIHNWLVLFMWRMRGRWNRSVRRVACALLIGTRF